MRHVFFFLVLTLGFNNILLAGTDNVISTKMCDLTLPFSMIERVSKEKKYSVSIKSKGPERACTEAMSRCRRDRYQCEIDETMALNDTKNCTAVGYSRKTIRLTKKEQQFRFCSKIRNCREKLTQNNDHERLEELNQYVSSFDGLTCSGAPRDNTTERSKTCPDDSSVDEKRVWVSVIVSLGFGGSQESACAMAKIKCEVSSGRGEECIQYFVSSGPNPYCVFFQVRARTRKCS